METIAIQNLDPAIACLKCKKEIQYEVRFCPHCGEIQTNEEDASQLKKHLIPVLLFYCISLIGLGIAGLLHVSDYHDLFYIDLGFSLYTLIFALFYFKELKGLLNIKKVNLKILLYVISLSFIYAIVVFYSMDFINLSILNENTNRYYPIFENSAFPLFFTILSIALQPAIFEELAFRGFVLSNLMNMTSKSAAVFISALMFAIIHLSIISLIWILPMALCYALLRNKFNVLWYGIFAHFTHNSTIVIMELYEDGLLREYMGTIMP